MNYVRSCQQVKASRQNHQQLLLPIDIHLYSKIQYLLQNEGEAQLQAAIKLFRDTMERYKQQAKLAKQRLQHSGLTFDATLELPCAYHPQGANVVLESDSFVPYLEMEECHIDVNVRTTNRRQVQNQQYLDEDSDEDEDDEDKQNQPHEQQRHIYTATFGTSTQWEATGKSGTEVSVSTDYQLTPTSKTTWNFEVTAPATKVAKERSASAKRPIKLQVSTTREFVSGTVMNAGVRGSITNFNSWEYFVTSFRKLSMDWLNDPSEVPRNPNVIIPNVRGSFAGGMKMFSGQPLFGFVTLTTIPPPKPPEQHHQHQQQSTMYDENGDETTASGLHAILASPWECSTPELSVRCGYHPNPLHASIKFEEFGKSWASMSSSWSWNIAQACSNIKAMLSVDLWGLYEDNDTTTIRTGLKHDLESGWIWLWEWEEADWTLKVPISLSVTKNNAWIAAAVGTQALTSDILHSSVGSLIASYFVMKVARSMVAEWTTSLATRSGNVGTGRRKQTSDATSHEHSKHHSQDLFQLDKNDDSGVGRGTYQPVAITSLTSKIARKKRELELARGGLVIRSAKLVVHGNDQSFLLSKGPHDLTNILQFWVNNSKLALPPLTSQKAPDFYFLGSGSSQTSSSASWCSNVSTAVVQPAVEWIQHRVDIAKVWRSKSKPNTFYKLVVRYEMEGKLYEINLHQDEEIVLPSAKALLLGSAALIS